MKTYFRFVFVSVVLWVISCSHPPSVERNLTLIGGIDKDPVFRYEFLLKEKVIYIRRAKYPDDPKWSYWSAALSTEDALFLEGLINFKDIKPPFPPPGAEVWLKIINFKKIKYYNQELASEFDDRLMSILSSIAKSGKIKEWPYNIKETFLVNR